MGKKKVVRKKNLRKKNIKKGNKLLAGLGLAIAALVIGYAIYAGVLYKNSEEERRGFVTCNKENTICELSQHIHADINVNACGEYVIFPKEKGRPDSQQHTHKEVNKIHWHARVRVDSATREPIDKSYLTIERFFSDINYELPKNCPGESQSLLTVSVNGQSVEEKLDYIWKDRDEISVVLE